MLIKQNYYFQKWKVLILLPAPRLKKKTGLALMNNMVMFHKVCCIFFLIRLLFICFYDVVKNNHNNFLSNF